MLLIKVKQKHEKILSYSSSDLRPVLLVLSFTLVDPAPASWIKVVGMLPTYTTHPNHPELSQAGSLKQTHLVFTVVDFAALWLEGVAILLTSLQCSVYY